MWSSKATARRLLTALKQSNNVGANNSEGGTLGRPSRPLSLKSESETATPADVTICKSGRHFFKQLTSRRKFYDYLYSL